MKYILLQKEFEDIKEQILTVKTENDKIMANKTETKDNHSTHNATLKTKAIVT